MPVKPTITLIAIVALTGCVVINESVNALSSDVHTDPLTCSTQLVGNSRSAHGELDSGDIRLVNWNIQKGGDPQWTAIAQDDR